MMDAKYKDLLEKELKKLVKENIKVEEDAVNWLILLQGKEIIIPKINNTIVRKSILGNK